MSRYLSKINTEVFVTSTLYYPKEQIEKFVNLFSSLDIIDERLKVYLDTLKSLLKNGSFDNLPDDPIKRKEKNSKLIRNKLETLTNSIQREKLISWFDKAAEMDHDLELYNELIYRYCWAEYLDRILLEETKKTDFQDKLNIKPIIPHLEQTIIRELGDIKIVEEEDTNSEIYKTGIEELDEIVKMRRTNFCVIAARTTVGKSLFMLNQATYNAKKKKKVVYVSLEESEVELAKRIFNNIKNYKKEDKENVKKYLRIYTPESSSPDTILNEIANYIKQNNIGAVFIDYLQLMKYPGVGDFESLRTLTRELKLFAIQNNVLLVTASQIRREAETLGNSLSTLYGTSTLEADANVIISLELTRKENIRINNQASVKIQVLKNRSGEQKEIPAIINYSDGTVFQKDPDF